MPKSIRYLILTSIFILLLTQLLIRCIDPVDLTSIGSNQLLVVDGFLSDEVKAHRVSLSQSVPLNDTVSIIPETEANVRIVDSQGRTFTLKESSPGIYLTEPGVSGIVGEQYTLEITRRDGRAYSSEPVTLKSTPPIDSVYARYITDLPGRDNGIYIFLDTQDPSGQTKALRWEYDETYQIQVPFPSQFEWLGGRDINTGIIFRDQSVGICWATQSLQNILVRSTQNLQTPRISEFLLRFLPEESDLMQKRYSILVRQYALDEGALRFWETLRDINETQGTLFDIQPGVVSGNVRSLNSNEEVVLGYFDASQVSELRAFFQPSDFFADGFSAITPQLGCFQQVDTVGQARIFDVLEARGAFVEIYETAGMQPSVTFLIVPKECANCTGRGTNIQPDFWE